MSKRAKTKLEKESINPVAAKELQKISDEDLKKLVQANILRITVEGEKGGLLSREINRRGLYLQADGVKEVISYATELVEKDKDLFGFNEKGL